MPQVLAPGLELFRSLANLLSHDGKGIPETVGVEVWDSRFLKSSLENGPYLSRRCPGHWLNT